jgi:gluconate 2-dehydrogenase gamma chain
MAQNNHSESEEKAPSSAGVSRRNLFHILGSVPAVAALAAGSALAETPMAQMDHMHPDAKEAPGKGPYQRQTFNDQEWRTVGVLCDLIIPADDRSGSATQAGVPEFIDDWIAFRKREDDSFELEAQILGGLMWLDRESMEKFSKVFADASPDQQKQLIERVAWPDRAAKEDHAWVLFFDRFRDLTVSGFFSSKVGVADLPYLGNTAVAEWKGCPPNVWAIIEERLKNGYKGVAQLPTM